jgi:inosine-uridine nucleoside N-ribohydrolase
MGGAIDVPGNINDSDDSDLPNDVAEWNFYCDPKSLERVWSSDLNLTLVPLDVILPAPFTPHLTDRLINAGRKSRCVLGHNNCHFILGKLYS